MPTLTKWFCLAVAAQVNVAVADTAWTALPTGVSVKEMFSGRTVLMYKTQLQYYRSDGFMVDYDKTTDWYTVRGWRIDDRGRMCWLIAKQPDHLIDCAEIHVSMEDDGKFRYKWEAAQGGSPFEYVGEPTGAMIHKLEEIAGQAK